MILKDLREAWNASPERTGDRLALQKHKNKAREHVTCGFSALLHLTEASAAPHSFPASSEADPGD